MNLNLPTRAACLLIVTALISPWRVDAQLPHFGHRSSRNSLSSETCPPPGFDTVKDFNLSRYASAPWYVQKQLPLSYQPVNELFCVRAVYKLINPNNPKEGVLVFNSANQGKVNGPTKGTRGVAGNNNGSFLIAVPDSRATGPTAASKLRVGPQVLKQTLPPAAWYSAFGPYWVAAIGDDYEWAIIVGGSPDVRGKGGCRPGAPGSTDQQYFGGFWLFSRKPVDPSGTKVMLSKAEQLGLDTSGLLEVKQEGCKYSGAPE